MSQTPMIDDEPEISEDEIEIAAEDQAEVEISDEPSAGPALAGPVEPAQLPLMQVLPADFPLPALIRFVPDQALLQAAQEATRYALSIEVKDQPGLTRADAAVTALRRTLKAITDHFEEPATIANDVHKSITGTRSQWLADGNAAVKTVGKRMADEQLRLQRIADEERRKRQAEQDRRAREEARKRAEEAAKQKVPEPVVQQMREEAERTTAPPVAASEAEPAKLAGNTVVKTWKCRVVGTPAEAEPNPTIAEMSKAQLAEVMVLLQNIVAGKAPIAAIEINWSAVNARAKAEKSTFAIPGLEAFEDVGVRAKGSRVK